MKVEEKIEKFLNESFKTGDWVIQRKGKTELEETWALVIGKTPKGKTEVISIDDWRGIPAKKTITNWYPSPELIDVKDIPKKFVDKVLKKKKQLGR